MESFDDSAPSASLNVIAYKQQRFDVMFKRLNLVMHVLFVLLVATYFIYLLTY